MWSVQSLIRLQSSKLRDKRAVGGGPEASDSSRLTTSSEADYDSHLRRRRISLKGTERLKSVNTIQAPPQELKPEPHVLGSIIGRLAGVAWGSTPLRRRSFRSADSRAGFVWVMTINLCLYLSGFLLTVLFNVGSLALTGLLFIGCVIDELHLYCFWAMSIANAYKKFLQEPDAWEIAACQTSFECYMASVHASPVPPEDEEDVSEYVSMPAVESLSENKLEGENHRTNKENDLTQSSFQNSPLQSPRGSPRGSPKYGVEEAFRSVVEQSIEQGGVMLTPKPCTPQRNRARPAKKSKKVKGCRTFKGKIYPNDVRPPMEWSCSNSVHEIFFQAYVYVMHAVVMLWTLWCGKGVSDESSLIIDMELFKRWLSVKPPLTPLYPNDEMYFFDDEQTRFQLSMLFITEQMDFESFKQAYVRRWITWEPKTRSILRRVLGRWTWCEDEKFDIDSHIKHVKLNLKEKNIAQVMSELSTADLPEEQPQWEVWFITPTSNDGDTAAPVDGKAQSPMRAVQKGDIRGSGYSFIASKWNHAYADGVGMMASIVSRLGDEPVSFTSLPEHYRRQVPKWQQRLYYIYHGLFAATECLQFLCYCAFGTKLYKGLLAGSGYVSMRSTGVKHYSAPMLVEKKKLSNICQKLQNFAIERYAHTLCATKNKKMRWSIPANDIPAKPTMNDLLCYCLLNAVGQLKQEDRCRQLVEEILGITTKVHVHCGGSIQPVAEKVNIIIPMMCRTSMPSVMDNYTSLVPTNLPIPSPPQWVHSCCSSDGSESNADARSAISLAVDHVYRVKRQIDTIKRQNCRVTLFLILYLICKALPANWASRIHARLYQNMQFCSTNVAAPAIDARFCDKIVHGLFFWPAVAAGSTCGSSWISLDDDVQASTVVDETEMRRAIALANEILAERDQPPLGEQDIDQFLAEFSDIIPRLIEQEIDRLATLLL